MAAGSAAGCRIGTLRGFEPGGPPADPHTVLGGLLLALGVPDERVAQLDPPERLAQMGRGGESPYETA